MNKLNIKVISILGIIIISIILVFRLWYNNPNPKTIEISPFPGFDKINNELIFEAKLSKIESDFSIFDELYGAITSLSKYKDFIEIADELNSIVEDSNNLKMHKETIKVPANAGGYYIEGLGVYVWQKTYSRFFSKSKVNEINAIILIGNQFYYVQFSNSIFNIKGTLYLGEVL